MARLQQGSTWKLCIMESARPTQDLKPKAMPVLVIMPDNNLSYGLRCDVDPSRSPVKGKSPSAAAPCVGSVGAAPSPAASADAVVEAQAAEAEGPGHHADAAWQHGFACGTAAAAAAFGRQASGQQALESGGAAGDGAAVHGAEVDVEAGLPTPVCTSSHALRRHTQNICCVRQGAIQVSTLGANACCCILSCLRYLSMHADTSLLHS